MAIKNFALVDGNNIVTNITIYDVDSEAEGVALYRAALGDDTANVVETFQNANDASTRWNYAGIGYTWDSANSAFYEPKPFDSWTLDSSYQWQAPVTKPNTDYVGDIYLISQWNEGESRWDGFNATTDTVEYVWNPNTLAWDSI
tara:strand:+ start:104 stop:535 length:432 start_codon:yes stop_codon:yes gene_type:complete